MTKDSFKGRVGFAEVDFQNEVRVAGEISPSLVSYLRTEAFPLSAPPSLRGAPNYGGIKVFAYQGQFICVAKFFNAGRTDSFHRAIPTSNVLVFERNLYDRGFRNLPVLSDFLSDVSVTAESLEEYQSVLMSIYAEASITDSEERFNTFIEGQQVDYRLLATAMALLVTHRSLVICSSAQSRGMSLFSTLFALAPPELLTSVTWCNYADSVSGRHEEVVLLRCHFEAREGTWFGKVKRFLGNDAQRIGARVDVETGAALGVNSKSTYRLVENIIHELRMNELKLPLDFEKRFQLFMTILGNCYKESANRVDRLLPGDAPKEILQKLVPFLHHT